MDTEEIIILIVGLAFIFKYSIYDPFIENFQNSPLLTEMIIYYLGIFEVKVFLIGFGIILFNINNSLFFKKSPYNNKNMKYRIMENIKNISLNLT